MNDRDSGVAPGSFRAWWLAIRPATLWAAVAPVLVGSACAAALGSMAPLVAAAALFAAICIQIGTNLANDLYDFRKGADVARVGPTRVVQAGLLGEGQVWIGTWVAFFLAGAAGLWLASLAGPMVAVVGMASIVAGVWYTAGRYSLAYLGLGDVFAFAFFGPVAVITTAWLQLGAVSELSVWLSLPIGALTTAILVVNNLRDVKTDAAVGKRTLAVRFGVGFSRAQYFVLVLGSFAVLVAVWWQEIAGAGILLPFSILPWALFRCRFVSHHVGAALNPALGGSARMLLVFALTLSIGVLFAVEPG